MASFRIALSMLRVLGCLRPITWTSSFQKFVYLVYTILAYSLLQSAMLTHLLDLIFNLISQQDFSENVYITMSMAGGVCKMIMLLANRNNIIVLLNTLRKEPFLPVDEEEMDIKSRLDKVIELNTIHFMGAIQVTLMVSWISTPIMEGKNRKLAFRAWFPYNYTSPILYTATYLYQAAGVIFDTSIHVACDTLFSGMLICIYGQLEILGLRLQKIASDKNQSAIKCARHHHQLYVYAARVNRNFRGVLFFQMIMSVSMVCFSIFQLTQTRSFGRAIENLMFMFCPLLQIFYYCWYGNEVRRKSLEVADMIFKSNWTSLDKDSKMTLLVIMIRSRFPMEFKSAHIMSVNVESFMAVLKTSYSAYNVLKQG